MFDKHLSRPSGFFVRPWQCCHCLKYCLCPKKALKNDSPYSSHCWRVFIFQSRGHCPQSRNQKLSVCSYIPMLFSGPQLTSLFPSPHQASSSIFHSWLSRQFLTGKKYWEIQSDETLLTWEHSPQPGTQKIFGKIPTNPLLAIWVTLQV